MNIKNERSWNDSLVNAGNESARLIIGTQNDNDDHIILAPSGNVGIGGNNNPFQNLTVTGNIHCSDIYNRIKFKY